MARNTYSGVTWCSRASPVVSGGMRAWVRAPGACGAVHRLHSAPVMRGVWLVWAGEGRPRCSPTSATRASFGRGRSCPTT